MGFFSGFVTTVVVLIVVFKFLGDCGFWLIFVSSSVSGGVFSAAEGLFGDRIIIILTNSELCQRLNRRSQSSRRISSANRFLRRFWRPNRDIFDIGNRFLGKWLPFQGGHIFKLLIFFIYEVSRF